MEVESDEDTEIQIKDLEQLNAVLEADEPISSSGSKCSLTTSSVLSSLKVEKYSRIETALALNKLTDDKLSRLERILIERLQECRRKIAENHSLERISERVDKGESFRYIHCCKPYFKDKSGFQPPDNDDTMLMRKSEMHDFSCTTTVPGWTVKDKSNFINLILNMSKQIKIKELNSQISKVRRDPAINESKKQSEILSLLQEIKNVKKKSLKELALPIDHEYDWDAIENNQRHRHSAQEHRSLWKLFLHPSINKNCWSKTEHSNLQRIAHEYKFQDWDAIASELNTKRTAYQCFVYFRTNMSNTFTFQKWTKEEEEYLRRLIEYYKEDDYIPWGRVAASMESRTKMQIYNKYLRLVTIRKGRFLQEEDAVILNFVNKYGENFFNMKKYLPGRSVMQLKSRYRVLMKKRISTVWTVEEDKKLIQLMATQDSNINYASISKFLPGKDRIHLRSRYIILMRWMQRNPNVDIVYCPRRGARVLSHGHATGDLSNALVQLKERMQSEVVYKKSKKISSLSTENEIDDAIVAFFVTENMNNAHSKNARDEMEHLILSDNTTVPKQSLNTTNLIKILILLKAKLNQKKFQQSQYVDIYPELLKPEKQVSLVKFKSYSKKKTVDTITLNNGPDIWGNNMLGPTEYVLPPHYLTITGCKSLINLISAKELKKITDIESKNRNLLYKAELHTLMERFNILFLWPTLLSNEVPSVDFNDESLKLNPVKGVQSVLNRRNIRNFQKNLIPLDDDFDDESSTSSE